MEYGTSQVTLNTMRCVVKVRPLLGVASLHSGPILGFLSNGYIIKYFLKFIENILWCKKIFEAKRVILIQENRKMVVSQTSCQ